jgi:subtilisin
MLKRAVLALFVALLAVPAAALGNEGYVVVYRDSVTDPAAVTSSFEHAQGIDRELRYGAALKGFSADLSKGQLKWVQQRPEVAFVAKDVTFRAASMQPVATGETVPPGIRRVSAASLSEAHPAATTSVAVLDTGVDTANADLDVVSGKNCVSTSSTSAKDDNGHGTNVAGIIAARDTGATVAGVAPGTRIVAVKVLNNKATGTLSQILCGIDWVTANAATYNIKVANMSITGSGKNDGNCGNTNNDAEHKAICRSAAAGITFVASAGNAKADFASSIPASYPEVLTVTAMSDTDGLPGARGPVPSCLKGEADDRYAAYSNYANASAARAHTIAAPGTCVVSDKLGGGTSMYYGTSQAAPHVAGTVALCIGNGGVDGPCAGLAPSAVIARVRADAAAWGTLATGFNGDPLRPISSTKYYGYEAYAGGY